MNFLQIFFNFANSCRFCLRVGSWVFFSAVSEWVRMCDCVMATWREQGGVKNVRVMCFLACLWGRAHA